ncbi:hypothetical protein PBT90_14875 [Algoriphagus halophytocola]|uniref:Uncharacterized protein n=1 Tax=Algoriphagus halophytocola TaxID=2991499 RepID=A0ABY6MLX4_9BACT|nr:MULTISPECIES: hypothetical protein [unclassified Algoriphagus]UZD24663.1 hypothetical protein OM944_09210 [Algoriphagus sp. TR-M5]WBL42031.1 hypothetical protein PBT90_14875 [Algoriphagus sp. TR-M9]
MKEYSPKPDLWSKIQKQKDFDSQVKMHAANLPIREPKAELWSDIEQELDQRKPVVSLWKYGLAAAAIALIVVIAGTAYLQLGEKESEVPLITANDTNTTAVEIPETENPPQPETEKPTPEPKQVLASGEEKPKQKSINRASTDPIEVPPLRVSDLSIEKNLVADIIIPPTPEVEPQKTYHKVAISWGLQERVKFKTNFGSPSPENLPNAQLSRANTTNNSIKIKFQKD